MSWMPRSVRGCVRTRPVTPRSGRSRWMARISTVLGTATPRLVLFSAMTHRGPGSAAVTVAQVQVPVGTKETTQVPALAGRIEDLAGALVTVDAAHTSAATARYLVQDAAADYLMTTKSQRSALYAAALKTGLELITGTEPGHTCEERGHGRISRWTTWTTGLPPGSEIARRLPHTTRFAVIRRDTADLNRRPRTKEFAFIATSRPSLDAAGISRHTRGHWGIENLSHRARDTIRHEDQHQAHTGNGPQAMATLRNLALGLLTLHGTTKTKQTIQAIGRNPTRAIPLITQRHRPPDSRRL
ncbi:MAG: ISAs1 family transposase [Streptosporangiales bacterium]|nr:ISAs1 family transposase [Streptosporangiales bacterium]